MTNYELGIMNGGMFRSLFQRGRPSSIRHSSFVIPRCSHGFTIVELLMVIGIISVLITITVSSVSGSMRSARAQKAAAICKIVEQGMATYYAQKDEWPVDVLNQNSVKPNADANGTKNTKNDTVYLLESSDVRLAVKKVIEEGVKNKSPMMDVSGLYVARQGGKYGMDFMDAVRGTKKNPEGIRLSNMTFGYPDADSGEFREFRMMYSPDSDTLKVSQQ